MATTIKCTSQSFSAFNHLVVQLDNSLFVSNSTFMNSNKYDVLLQFIFFLRSLLNRKHLPKFAMLRGILLAAFAVIFAVYVDGHGRLWEPAGRGTEWRKGYWVPEPKRDYNDDQVYCGGRGVGILIISLFRSVERHLVSVSTSARFWWGRSPDRKLHRAIKYRRGVSCYDWLDTRVECLGKALFSHLSRSPEHIREVSVMGNITSYYNLSADRACT